MLACSIVTTIFGPSLTMLFNNQPVKARNVDRAEIGGLHVKRSSLY